VILCHTMSPKTHNPRAKTNTAPKRHASGGVRTNFQDGLRSNAAVSSASTTTAPFTMKRCSSDPPPLPNVGEKWIKREYQGAIYPTSSTAGTEFNLGDLLETSLPDPGLMVIESISAWSMTGVKCALTGYSDNLATFGVDNPTFTDFASVTGNAAVGLIVDPSHARFVAPTTTLGSIVVGRNKLNGTDFTASHTDVVVIHVVGWTRV